MTEFTNKIAEWYKKQKLWVKIILFLFLWFIFIPVLILPLIKNSLFKKVFIGVWIVFMLIVFASNGAFEKEELNFTVEGLANNQVLLDEEHTFTIKPKSSTGSTVVDKVFVNNEEIKSGLFSGYKVEKTLQEGENKIVIKIIKGEQEISETFVVNVDLTEKKARLAKEAKEKKVREERENFLKSFINKTVPYEKWGEYGTPETLEGTDSKYWVAYLDKIDMSFISTKENDTIIFTGNGKDSAIKEKNNLVENRKKEISKGFSGWDGSHTELTKLIKKGMNDPKSYEHVETKYWDMGDHLIVNQTFRGKNAFGGTVRNTVKAKVSIEGSVIEIIEQY